MRIRSDLFQGYHRGRPMSYDRIVDLLTTSPATDEHAS